MNITLLTRPFGRGTDFMCLDNKVNQNGGLVVVQTFLSLNPTQETQIKGRTARQQNKGSYYLIINLEDLRRHPWIMDDE